MLPCTLLCHDLDDGTCSVDITTVALEVTRHASGYHVSLQYILSSYRRHVTAVRTVQSP